MIGYSKALKAGAILENPPRAHLRKQYIFALSNSCDEAIDRLAHTYMCSRNHVIERMFALDYADLFRRFRELRLYHDVDEPFPLAIRNGFASHSASTSGG